MSLECGIIAGLLGRRSGTEEGDLDNDGLDWVLLHISCSADIRVGSESSQVMAGAHVCNASVLKAGRLKPRLQNHRIGWFRTNPSMNSQRKGPNAANHPLGTGGERTQALTE